MAAGTTGGRRLPTSFGRPVLALICLLCLAAVATPSIASAATERGAMEGTVTHGGSPVEGIEVRTTGPEEISTHTGANGGYSFTDILEGEYTVYFSGVGFVEQSQEGVRVNEDATTTVDAELEEAGTLTGTVVDETTTDPLEGAEVCAEREGGEPGHGCTTTNSSGDFKLELPAGEYEVTYSLAGYGTRVVHHKTVQKGGTTTVDAELGLNGAIKGTVTGPGNTPIAETMVCVDGTNGLYFIDCGFTGSDGEYASGEIPPGEFEVEYTGLVCNSGSCEAEACEQLEGCTRSYVPQVYDHAVVLNNRESTVVTVAPAETVEGIDASLLPGSKIEGRVILARTGAPLAGINVSAQPVSASARSQSATTDANGEYTIEGLAEAAFYVRFEEAGCEEPVATEPPECPRTYVTQWYGDVAEAEDSTPVNVTSATPQTGIDAAMVEINPPAAQVPGFTSNPTLGGTAAVGSTLTCSPGTWSNDPTSVAYAWQRNGMAIAGQAGSTYAVTAGDQGTSLACVVMIGNSAGSASATSNAVAIPAAPTTPLPPPPTAKPATGPSTATAKGGKVTLTLKCGGQVACKGSLKLVYEEKTKKNGKTTVKKLTVGSLNSFSVAAGGSKAIKVKLTDKGKSLLAEAGKKGLKVKLTGCGVKTRTLTVKAA